jgi:hypothetical protein
MVLNIPQLVTIDVGRAPTTGTAASAEPLCTEELLVLIDEIADLGVPAVRFSLDASEASDGALRAIEHARQLRLAPIVALRGNADGMLVGAIARAGAAGIAVPLHSHAAAIHQTIAGPDGDWGRSITLAHLIRQSGAALEIETRITARNALPLLPLMETVEALQAAQWRLAFGGSNISNTLETTTVTVILHATARDRLRIIVHDLPQLSAVMANTCGRFLPPDLRNLTSISAGESLRVSECGDVCFDDLAAGGRRLRSLGPRAERCTGSIRRQPIDMIYRLSRMSETPQSSPLQANTIAPAAEIEGGTATSVDRPTLGPDTRRNGSRHADSFYHDAMV